MTVKVEFFYAPDCPSCGGVRRRLQAAAAAAKVALDWRDTNVLHALERAVDLGLLRTPAVVIDNDTVFRAPPGDATFVAALRACQSEGDGATTPTE